MDPGLSALKGQNAADIIISIQPIIHIISTEFKAHHCDYCLKFSTKPLNKCSKCRQLYYCHQNCQRMDWVYHKNECQVLANKKFKSGETQSSERLLIRLWLTIKSDHTFASKRYQMIDGKHISLNDIKINTKQLSKNMDRMIEFQLICNHFKDYGLVYDQKELFHWFGVITCSSIIIKTKVYPSEQTFDIDMPKELGPGIYIELYSVSHSCLPNSAIVLNGLSLQLRAMKPIPVGSLITRCYVNMVQNNSELHKQLKNEYLIDCNPSVCPNQSNNDKIDKLFNLMTDDSKLNGTQLPQQILQLAIDIFGQFHPDLTQFYSILAASLSFQDILVNPNETLNRLGSDFYRKFDRHLLITYGADHPFYTVNFKQLFTLYFKV